jgi:hypothetical protein
MHAHTCIDACVYVSGRTCYRFCKTEHLDHRQASCFLSIMKHTFDRDVHSNEFSESMRSSFDMFSHVLLRHCVERPPWRCRGCFHAYYCLKILSQYWRIYTRASGEDHRLRTAQVPVTAPERSPVELVAATSDNMVYSNMCSRKRSA